MARAKQRFTSGEVYFLLIASSLAIVSTHLHEIGHALACMYLGLEILEFVLDPAKVTCTPIPDGPHILSRLAGGTFVAALLSVPLAVDRVRRAKHAKYAIVIVMVAQAANVFLETATYEAYTHFYLHTWVIAPGVGVMMAAIVWSGALRWPPARQSNSK